MRVRFSRLIDSLSEYFANRKGLLPVLGLILIFLNLILQLFPAGWLSQSHLFLHIGVIIAILGLMLSWAL
jgi:hypothetical protein